MNSNSQVHTLDKLGTEHPAVGMALKSNRKLMTEIQVTFEAWMTVIGQAHLLRLRFKKDMPDRANEYLSAGTQHKWEGWYGRAVMTPKEPKGVLV
jgi:hypothetical protein